MQCRARPCNTMQYHASLIAADGTYHCPVGSIWPFLPSTKGCQLLPPDGTCHNQWLLTKKYGALFDLDSMLYECEDTNAFICRWRSLQDNQIRNKSVKFDTYFISCKRNNKSFSSSDILHFAKMDTNGTQIISLSDILQKLEKLNSSIGLYDLEQVTPSFLWSSTSKLESVPKINAFFSSQRGWGLAEMRFVATGGRVKFVQTV